MKRLVWSFVALVLLAVASPTYPETYHAPFGEQDSAPQLGDSSSTPSIKGDKERQLLEAAEYYDLRTARRALERGAAVDAVDKSGYTALMWASGDGFPEMVKLLLSKGANSNAKDRKGWTSLHYAATYGFSDIVHLLIAHRADVNSFSVEGSTPLTLAVARNRLHVVPVLLDNHAHLESRSPAEWTPLMFAAAFGRPEMVSLLLQRGADPKAQDKEGRTAWELAKAYGHVDVAKILEEAPARGEFSRSGSTYTQGDSIQRSFFEGPQSGPPEHPVVRESPNADLLDAAVGNDLARATAALQKGASVDARNRHGNTALMIASEMGYPKMVELLVQKGANVNLQGEFGFTALTCAAMAGEQAITEFLIRNQANREIRCTCHGAAILSLAIRRGRDEIVQSLIKAGVNIETKDNYRWTPLIWAASFGRSQAVKLLLENGAKTNSRCSTGETALDWAKKRGHDEVVRILSGDIIRISR